MSRPSPHWLVPLLSLALACCEVPGCERTSDEGLGKRCANNLREIQRLGLLYANAAGGGVYPHSEKGSTGSLQLLEDTGWLQPKLFICPASGMKPAETDDQGRFQLDDEHCSYERVPWKLSTSDPYDSILAFDRTPCHSGGRHVVFVDGSVDFLMEARFQDLLSRQARAREAQVTPPASSR